MAGCRRVVARFTCRPGLGQRRAKSLKPSSSNLSQCDVSVSWIMQCTCSDVKCVRGASAVAEAVRVCWASASSARATSYWNHLDGESVPDEPDMAVFVQRLVDADTSGVVFTPARPGDDTRIEASWGLGPSVAAGTVTPDTYQVASDGRVRRTIARKATRLDRDDLGVTTSDVPPEQQTLPTLDDATAATLASLGRRIAALFEGPQDIEWAIANGMIWILQARPITASTPQLPPKTPTAEDASLIGTPGSHGTVTGAARVLHGPSDFPRVQPGDIVICPCTDPAWTPLFRIASAIITETGGTLSHAAIVAREHGIPQATTRIHDGTRVFVNGTEGTVTAALD